jgi:hypothetical protein
MSIATPNIPSLFIMKMIKPSDDYEVMLSTYPIGECCDQIAQIMVNEVCYEIVKDTNTNKIIMHGGVGAGIIAFNDINITFRKALSYIEDVNPDKFVIDWIEDSDISECIDNILDSKVCDLSLMQGTIKS